MRSEQGSATIVGPTLYVGQPGLSMGSTRAQYALSHLLIPRLASMRSLCDVDGLVSSHHTPQTLCKCPDDAGRYRRIGVQDLTERLTIEA